MTYRLTVYIPFVKATKQEKQTHDLVRRLFNNLDEPAKTKLLKDMEKGVVRDVLIHSEKEVVNANRLLCAAIQSLLVPEGSRIANWDKI